MVSVRVSYSIVCYNRISLATLSSSVATPSSMEVTGAADTGGGGVGLVETGRVTGSAGGVAEVAGYSGNYSDRTCK